METKKKLTTQQRLDIIKFYQEGTTIIQLSSDFKVSRPTIYNILKKANLTSQNEIFYKNQNINKDMEDNTTFLGVSIDTINGPYDFKIKKALKCSASLLDITQFIQITKFKLNMTMFDYFWQVMVGNRSSLVGRPILEWFGYEGEYFNQKKCFKKMLKNNAIEFRELTQEDKEIDQYPAIQQELQELNQGARTCAKFLIMEPDDLKMAIMQLKTKKGDIIRQYYIDLEKLLKLYVEYTLYFNHRESQRKITDLEYKMDEMTKYMRSLGISLETVKDQNEELLDKNNELLDDNKEVKRKLGIAVKDRAPLPDDKKKQERFVLLKRNDEDYMPYYTIRAQDSYTTRRLRTQNELFPNLQILLDFKANPNSKSLYIRIKDKLKDLGVTFEGNNIDLNGVIEEEKLIEEMKVINDAKKNI
ncbi:hypothetical protein IIV22_136L [Invertebrate iridescent virus 22]|uniref:Uncharacterized protein n=1 Tax=Invertebrate iridescent virus 22 TaxID=345198 RepID=S6DA90_9VIRU|nr:hypothetical protein IIV22_136L [Invertebrate iridescent virus 22]CCV01813.1 hypothetical protein IIV22_136L [Invertebrate iridescent virus 22]